MGNAFKLLLVIGVIVLLLLAGPWLFIWAINTLISSAMAGAAAGSFVPQISFGFWTWLAAVILGGFTILGRVRRS